MPPPFTSRETLAIECLRTGQVAPSNQAPGRLDFAGTQGTLTDFQSQGPKLDAHQRQQATEQVAAGHGVPAAVAEEPVAHVAGARHQVGGGGGVRRSWLCVVVQGDGDKVWHPMPAGKCGGQAGPQYFP